jgi:hypothetical protein
MAKLRPILKARRTASVKRRDVTAAVRSVMASRKNISGRYVVKGENQAHSGKSSAKKRK